MYLGRSSITSGFNLASTKLHMDITDAYNVMLSAAECPDGKPGFAEWTFLRAKDACLFRKFMMEECGFEGPEDVIHSQTINLTPDLLERLFTKYGVRPITVAQYPGDIVFIPAYCAHQVYVNLPPPFS
jgi:lysine-specific demethylase 3